MMTERGALLGGDTQAVELGAEIDLTSRLQEIQERKEEVKQLLQETLRPSQRGSTPGTWPERPP